MYAAMWSISRGCSVGIDRLDIDDTADSTLTFLEWAGVDLDASIWETSLTVGLPDERRAV